MDNLEQTKLLLGIDGDSKDDLLSLLITDTENLILSYCRIETMPTKLQSLVPIIAADMYRVKGYGAADAPQTVKSISEGDRTVSFEIDTEYDYLSRYYKRLLPFINRKGRVPSDLG